VNAFSSNSDVTVSGGATLQLDFYSNSIAGLNGAGSVNLGLGTLTVNPAVAAGFSGGISGLGGLTKVGSGTQTLSGINTYFGATTLIEGTMQAGAVNAFSPNSEVALSSGASLNLNDHDNQIFSVSGSGGNISLGSSSANLIINGIGTNTNFSGFISGNGVLVKEGSSTQILSGVNTFTGPTIINGGRLAIHSPGSITSQVTVNASGTLSGTGTIIGNVQVENGGVILPGASVGTLTIQGNLGLSAGSQTNVDIDPFISSLIVVSGTADLDGTLNLLTSIEELYPVTQVYTILRSEGGLLLDPNSASGFTEFKTVAPATFFEFSPLYFPDKVELHSIYTAPVIPTNGLTGNRLRLADYFNAESRFFFRTNLPLYDLPEEQIAPLLDSISPARLSASSWAVANIGIGVVQQIRDRVETFRFLHLKNRSANRSSSEEFSVYVASNQDDRMIPRGSVRIAEHNHSSFSAYANWFGQIIHQKEQQQNPTFTIFSNQANMGIEKYFARGIIGLQANYAASTITQDRKSYSQLVGGSIYGAAFLNDLFVDTSFFGSRVWYESYRMIAIPQFDAEAIYGKAKSKHKGYCLLPHLGIGYDFVLSWGVLEPYLGVDWAFLHETAFTESGPALLNMHIYGRNSSLLRSQIGFNAYQAFESDCTTVMLKEEVSYVYLKPDNLGRIKATVPGSVNNFTVYAMTKAQSRGRVGLELFIKKKSGVFLAGKYCLEAGSSAIEQNISATIGKDF
jgi:autotransporter-associated beta strand protein